MQTRVGGAGPRLVRVGEQVEGRRLVEQREEGHRGRDLAHEGLDLALDLLRGLLARRSAGMAGYKTVAWLGDAAEAPVPSHSPWHQRCLVSDDVERPSLEHSLALEAGYDDDKLLHLAL